MAGDGRESFQDHGWCWSEGKDHIGFIMQVRPGKKNSIEKSFTYDLFDRDYCDWQVSFDRDGRFHTSNTDRGRPLLHRKYFRWSSEVSDWRTTFLFALERKQWWRINKQRQLNEPLGWFRRMTWPWVLIGNDPYRLKAATRNSTASWKFSKAKMHDLVRAISSKSLRLFFSL